MEDKKVKPVWRMNTGNSPKDRSNTLAVAFLNGTIQEGCKFYNWSLDDEDCYPIYAYQTTRTREAKR